MTNCFIISSFIALFSIWLLLNTKTGPVQVGLAHRGFRILDNIWLKNAKEAKATEPNGKPQYGLALSSLVSARQVDFMQNINDGCLMTMSPITTPCCRNTFVIVSTANETLRGDKMVFGDEFYLKAENYGDPTAPALYVRYTPMGAPSPANRMPLQLSSIKDTNCRFTVIPLLPSDRIEGQGSPVQTGTRLIVKNCIADLNLCVMNQQWMQTFFGPECGVTCRNCIDIHKRVTAENIFQLVSDVETKARDTD